jgi:predicted acyl esterase
MEQRRAWIPMADDTRLAARIFLPDELPAAVLLEALPYRMDDLLASSDAECERLCAEGGFAVCRLDLRGTGSSEGLALDEYHVQEQADCRDAIAWLAEQEWSTGRVGMYGTSWGGFNSIQVAMERPPVLGAIASIYASDDRYTDDVHYMGGVLKALDLVDRELRIAASNALPPVPALFGEGWREQWLARLEVEPWILRWLEEQADGPYWRHGSLRPGYGRIACPTLIVAGWADGYTNVALRGLEALSCPRRVIVGPWSHMPPATSVPGPNVDLVPELVRWFARWLRDEENGVDEEPPLAVFVRRSTEPDAEIAEMRGEWRSEPAWPPERLRHEVLRPGSEGHDRLDVKGDVGTAAWTSCAGAPPWTLPEDQRADDARSLAYTWSPLEEELEILGHARVRLTLTSTSPVAFLSAKLCDVFPAGPSALVARGVLNLAHRNGHAAPEALVPGEPTTVEIELEATSWIFEPGHRVRLSLAGSDWPNVWPPPQGGQLLVERGSVELDLPVLEGSAGADPPRFQPPPPAPVAETEPAAGAEDEDDTDEAEPEPTVVRRVEHDGVGRQTRAVVASFSGHEAHFGATVRERFEGLVGVSEMNPGRAWVASHTRYDIAWPEATVFAEAHLALRSDSDAYHVVLELVAGEEGDEGIGHLERRYERTIPRCLQ